MGENDCCTSGAGEAGTSLVPAFADRAGVGHIFDLVEGRELLAGYLSGEPLLGEPLLGGPVEDVGCRSGPDLLSDR